jgi:hypothetical protein
MSRALRTRDRVQAAFDDDDLVANAGLLLPATLTEQLGLEALTNTTVRQNQVSSSSRAICGRGLPRRCRPRRSLSRLTERCVGVPLGI